MNLVPVILGYVATLMSSIFLIWKLSDPLWGQILVIVAVAGFFLFVESIAKYVGEGRLLDNPKENIAVGVIGTAVSILMLFASNFFLTTLLMAASLIIFLYVSVLAFGSLNSSKTPV